LDPHESLATTRRAHARPGNRKRQIGVAEVKGKGKGPLVRKRRGHGPTTAEPHQAASVVMELRDQMQRVAPEWPAYGYRRITAELRQCGFAVNHKHVLRMVREDMLLQHKAQISMSRKSKARIPGTLEMEISAARLVRAQNRGVA
jgi:hypothetical protein